MDFVRHGMQGAQPRFGIRSDSMGGVMRCAEDMPWVLEHPDVIMMPASRNALPALLSDLEALEAEQKALEATRAALETERQRSQAQSEKTLREAAALVEAALGRGATLMVRARLK